MVTRTRTEVKGLRELGAALQSLGDDVAKKISRAGTGAAAQIVRKAAVANVERSPAVDTGSLRDAVIVRRLMPRETKLTSEHIVTVRGRGKPTNKKGQRIARAPHAHFVEFGTVNMPAEPFLRPALANNQAAALDAMVSRIKARIEKANRGGK